MAESLDVNPEPKKG